MKPTFNTFGDSDRRKREELQGNAIGAHVYSVHFLTTAGCRLG
ncbi:hypothetical protein BH09CHL1_BH09CHL1_35060 [soil metagenome]